MKLFERHTTHETPDLRPELHEDLPELPAGVTVPDDLSDMKLPVSVKPTHHPTAVRWLRWVPVGLGLAVGGLVVAVVIRDAGTETATPVMPTELIEEVNGFWPAGEGPPSNSLNMMEPVATVISAPQADANFWPAGEGPPSNSLNMTATGVTPWLAGEGPGSNSLDLMEM